MVTLFERLIGLNLPPYDPGPDPENPLPSVPEEQKMGLLAFIGCIDFQATGYITGQDAVGWFDLAGEQVSDMQYMTALANDAGAGQSGGRMRFLQAYSDFCFNGEGNTAPFPWQDELEFWTTLMTTVEQVGGTPTPMPQYLKDRLGV